MNALVYLESSAGQLPKSSLVAIGAGLQAKQLHGYTSLIGLVVGGANVKNAAEQAAKYGLDKILYVENSTYDKYLALPYAEAVFQATKETNADLVIACATTQGKDLMPRVAQMMDAAQASDVMEFVSEGRFRRPMYAGNVIAVVELSTAKKVVTVRGTAFEAASEAVSGASIESLNVSATSTGQEFVAFDTVGGDRPELTEAEVVVSGGRAMKSAENFEQYLAPLADVLNAALGASRAAVDSGYAPNDWQVGQTGKVVAPSLYIAIGISGAIQHLAGMKDSKVIVAINKDGDAPIFEVADYGLVADLYEAVPALTEAIKAAKG